MSDWRGTNTKNEMAQTKCKDIDDRIMRVEVLSDNFVHVYALYIVNLHLTNAHFMWCC
jgi:hypothetical protein